MFGGRDACSDSWQVEKIPDIYRNSTHVSIILTHLKPFTQYVYYVRTHTVAGEARGGFAEIKYFRTRPYKPEPVTNLSAVANGRTGLVIRHEFPN